MKTDWFCPVTGLQVTSHPDWVNRKVSPSFTANFWIIGSSILYSRPEGIADSRGVRNSLSLNEEVAKSIHSNNGCYIQIEDYGDLQGSSLGARRIFTSHMSSNQRLLSLLFCNLSTLLSVSVNISRRLNLTHKPVHISRDYRDAIRLATSLSSQENLISCPYLPDKQICFDDSAKNLSPILVQADPEWNVKTPRFSSNCILIDECIMHSVSEGRLELPHILLLTRNRLRCRSALPEGSEIQYIVVDSRRVTRTKQDARIQFMQSLKEWHSQFPFRMYIFYGANHFIKAAIQLGQPWLPFKAKTANDLNHALELIRQDRKAFPGDKTEPAENLPMPPIAYKDLENLVAFITSIDWEKEGIDHQFNVEEGHPLHLLFESVKLIKEEHDELCIDRKRLEQQLLQAAKQEAIGRLSGGIAHDFNNMMTVILSQAEMALAQLNENDPFYTTFKDIQSAAQRSADLTRQLLAFARKQTIAPRVLDLNVHLTGMLKMLRQLIGEDINLIWELASDLWCVKMDPSQLDQVMANLCINARDAISGAGTITIETKNTTLDDASFSYEPGFNSGDFVLLTVSDNGCGIGEESLSNIFEPFFTTKGVGEGTGLGLSTVYGIVKQNDGFIHVCSELGQGTSFKIYLPRHDSPSAVVQEKGQRKIESGQAETILLVEDETMITAIGKKMLTTLGYNTLAASLPSEALRIASEHEGEIDLVLTDVVMPEMNGKELAERLQRLFPGVKTLYMSGYTAEVIAKHGVLDDGLNFIQKPFFLADLAEQIKKVLNDG